LSLINAFIFNSLEISRFTQNLSSAILDHDLVTFSIKKNEPIPLAITTMIFEFEYSIGRLGSET